MPTAKRRETERPTEAEKSKLRFCWKRRGEEGQRGGAGGGADDVEGGVEEVLGVADEGDASLGDGGEVVEEEAVEHDQRDADHEGEGELEPLQEGGVAEAEDGAEVETGAEGSDGVEQEGAADDSGQDADGERVDADLAVEENGSKDDAEVVDERNAGLVEEDLADLKARAHAGADEEEELRGKDDAGERGAEMGAEGVGAEAGVGEPDVPGRGDFGEDDTGGEDDEHGGEDDGEGAVGTFVVAALAVAVEDGDERDGDGSSGEEVAEEVGEFEGGAVGILRGSGTEEVVDVFNAHQGEQAGAEGAQHEQDGGGAGGVGSLPGWGRSRERGCGGGHGVHGWCSCF